MQHHCCIPILAHQSRRRRDIGLNAPLEYPPNKQKTFRKSRTVTTRSKDRVQEPPLGRDELAVELLDLSARYAAHYRMEALCSRLLNSPLDEPLRLQFQTFAPELQRAWHEAVGLLRTYEDLGIVLPASSASSLEEFVGTLILEKHQHNYSDALLGSWKPAAPRVVKEAEQSMRTEPPETVSLLAKNLASAYARLNSASVNIVSRHRNNSCAKCA